ncbi:MAG TPA: hypothetical protein VI588_01935, partial [Candidatus Gracilibacteria bacterium]|nr:hypothetical protein [Candidatus Gracilibacteria bacterium]
GQVISLLSTFLMFSVLPGFKQYLDFKHFDKARKLYGRVWKILLVCGVLVVVCGSFAGSLAVEFLTHKKYLLPELWFVLPLMLLLAAISYGYDLILVTLFAFEMDEWILKNEILALLLAGVLFYASTLMAAAPEKLFLILIAAIAGETFMVARGVLKTRRLLQKLP